MLHVSKFAFYVVRNCETFVYSLNKGYDKMTTMYAYVSVAFES